MRQASDNGRAAPRCGQSNAFQRVGAVQPAVSTACYGRGARSAIAQDARRVDPRLATTRNPESVGSKLWEETMNIDRRHLTIRQPRAARSGSWALGAQRGFRRPAPRYPIFVIFEPSMPTPAIRPLWPKMNAYTSCVMVVELNLLAIPWSTTTTLGPTPISKPCDWFR
jgi:hypothetical protein